MLSFILPWKHQKSSRFLCFQGYEKRTSAWNGLYVRVCIRGKKCSFFGKFGILCFLVTPVLRFTLLLYYRPLYGTVFSSCRKQLIDLQNKSLFSYDRQSYDIKLYSWQISYSFMDDQSNIPWRRKQCNLPWRLSKKWHLVGIR